MPVTCERREFLKAAALMAGSLAGADLVPKALEVAYKLSASSNLLATIQQSFTSPGCKAVSPSEVVPTRLNRKVFNVGMAEGAMESSRVVATMRDLPGISAAPMNHNLGVRLDFSEYVGAACKMGMGWISIYAGHCNFDKQPWIMPTYRSAARLGIQTLWIINPQQLVSEDKIKQMISPILEVYQKYPIKDQKKTSIKIQGVNEPDLKPVRNLCNPKPISSQTAFWLRQNLPDCARFDRRLQKVSYQLAGDEAIVVTAPLHATYLMPQWFNYLIGEGVEIEKTIFSAHTYGSVENVWLTGAIMRATIGEDLPLAFTEIGSQSVDPSCLPKMFAMAQSFKPVFSIYHELLNVPNPDPGQCGWGAINKVTGTINERFFSIQDYNQSVAVQS